MKIFKTTLLCLVVVWLVAGLTLNAQDKKAQEAEMMKKWMAYSTPSEGHKFLKKLEGKFHVTSKMWMMPGAPMEKSEGKEVSTFMLDGRYLKGEFSTKMKGMIFHGFAITGFDNHKKVYETVWVDSMSTGMFVSRGKLDKTGKVLTQYAKTPCIMSGGTIQYRMVTKIVDDNTYMMLMYAKGGMYGEKEFLSMEGTYTKKK